MSDAFKPAAKRLAAHFKRTHQVEINHGQALNAIAAAVGVRDWATLLAGAQVAPDILLPSAARAGRFAETMEIVFRAQRKHQLRTGMFDGDFGNIEGMADTLVEAFHLDPAERAALVAVIAHAVVDLTQLEPHQYRDNLAYNFEGIQPREMPANPVVTHRKFGPPDNWNRLGNCLSSSSFRDFPRPTITFDIGPSGTGKSVAMMQRVLDFISNGAKVTVFDSGRTYRRAAFEMEGRELVLAADGSFSENQYGQARLTVYEAEELGSSLSESWIWGDLPALGRQRVPHLLIIDEVMTTARSLPFLVQFAEAHVAGGGSLCICGQHRIDFERFEDIDGMRELVCREGRRRNYSAGHFDSPRRLSEAEVF